MLFKPIPMGWKCFILGRSWVCLVSLSECALCYWVKGALHVSWSWIWVFLFKYPVSTLYTAFYFHCQLPKMEYRICKLPPPLTSLWAFKKVTAFMYLGVGVMYSPWQETCGGQRVACKSLFPSPPRQSQQTWQQEPYPRSHLADALYNRGDSSLDIYDAQLSDLPRARGIASAGDISALSAVHTTVSAPVLPVSLCNCFSCRKHS